MHMYIYRERERESIARFLCLELLELQLLRLLDRLEAAPDENDSMSTTTPATNNNNNTYYYNVQHRLYAYTTNNNSNNNIHNSVSKHTHDIVCMYIV